MTSPTELMARKTMRTINLKAILKAALVLACLLPFAASRTNGQVNLTAEPTMLTLPDGSIVPMWGYTCTVANGSTAMCASLNPNANGWSPVVITVPAGQDLVINLTNNLPTTPGAQTGIPTSLMIVGQVGGGLGSSATTTPSPDHSDLAASTATWPIAGSAPGFTPPPQPARVQSFSTEVATGVTTQLKWPSPRSGTYLIESGTHPSIQGPMGLYGILVVTAAPGKDANGKETSVGTAYPVGVTGKAVTYDAEVPLIFSELDPVQNNAVNTAVGTPGFTETAVWNHLASGGPVTSISVSNGGTGYSVTPTVTITGAGSGATATATVVGGVITAINVTNAGDGYPSAPTVNITDSTGSGAAATATVVTGGCGGGAHTCYPPAVNYSPLYYMINGVAFNKTNPSGSLFSAFPTTLAPASGTGSVLVRFVNAGSRMHVPSIVGSTTTGQTGGSNPTVTGFQLIAEDGNPLPGLPRVQSEVFMAAGKTYDVMIGATAAGAPALPVYAREVRLSRNDI